MKPYLALSTKIWPFAIRMAIALMKYVPTLLNLHSTRKPSPIPPALFLPHTILACHCVSENH